ncbi:MAG: hypothetical protein NZ992_03300 [Candidatus Korarchaeum sp.]|nr:hypothetical protein [Candidatus Korarchaeum sp.]MDW8035667.1 hypothetical protein [Candidatus Korarchaeum sp.]
MTEVKVIKVEVRPVDLDITLHPSFMLSLLYPIGRVYLKVTGRRKGCLMRVEGSYLITDCGKEALYWSGAWFMEILESEEPRSLAWLLDALKEHYPKLGLAVDPHDPLHILIPIFLSQSTDYHVNVIKWARELWRLTDDPFEAVKIAPKLSGSYQLKRLFESFSCLSSALNGDFWEVRKKLMNCKYCGPKVADAFLLFCMGDTASTPVDRHFASMAKKLGLWENLRLPNKRTCLKYNCSDCPVRCVRWLASESFSKLAGWVQTALYLHEKLYCSAKRCDKCLLKSHCSAYR